MAATNPSAPIRCATPFAPRRVAISRISSAIATAAGANRLPGGAVLELTVELEVGPRRGSRYLREAIDEVAGGAWSAPEARAARLLRSAGLPPFEQNAHIDLPDGRWLVVDFLWRSLGAVLEIDSRLHHGAPADADNTSDRHLVLETLGYSVVHRTPRYVATQPRAFVDGIGSWLAGRETLMINR